MQRKSLSFVIHLLMHVLIPLWPECAAVGLRKHNKIPQFIMRICHRIARTIDANIPIFSNMIFVVVDSRTPPHIQRANGGVEWWMPFWQMCHMRHNPIRPQWNACACHTKTQTVWRKKSILRHSWERNGIGRRRKSLHNNLLTLTVTQAAIFFLFHSILIRKLHANKAQMAQLNTECQFPHTQRDIAFQVQCIRRPAIVYFI